MRFGSTLFSLIFIAALVSGNAFAKLPPPGAETQAKAAEAKANAATQAEEQQKALERAQDRVVERYFREQKEGNAKPEPAVLPADETQQPAEGSQGDGTQPTEETRGDETQPPIDTQTVDETEAIPPAVEGTALPADESQK